MKAPIAVAQPVPSTTPYVSVGATDGPVQFADGLFSCFNDCKLCLVSCCFPGVVVGQLWERVKRQPRSACAYITAISLVSATIVFYLQSTCPEPEVTCTKGVCTAEPTVDVPASCSFANQLAGLTTLLLALLFMMVRAQVRDEYRIPPTCCGALDDCCCSFCCLPLAASQVMRHIGTHDATSYQICSSVGASDLPSDSVAV